MSEEQARRMGVLAGKAAHDDVVDATVVEGAIRHNDGIVTSNAHDIRKITATARATLRIEAI